MSLVGSPLVAHASPTKIPSKPVLAYIGARAAYRYSPKNPKLAQKLIDTITPEVIADKKEAVLPDLEAIVKEFSEQKESTSVVDRACLKLMEIYSGGVTDAIKPDEDMVYQYFLKVQPAEKDGSELLAKFYRQRAKTSRNLTELQKAFFYLKPGSPSWLSTVDLRTEIILRNRVCNIAGYDLYNTDVDKSVTDVQVIIQSLLRIIQKEQQEENLAELLTAERSKYLGQAYFELGASYEKLNPPDFKAAAEAYFNYYELVQPDSSNKEFIEILVRIYLETKHHHELKTKCLRILFKVLNEGGLYEVAYELWKHGVLKAEDLGDLASQTLVGLARQKIRKSATPAELTQAIAHIREAIQLGSLTALCMLGIFLKSRKKIPQAIAHFTTAIEKGLSKRPKDLDAVVVAYVLLTQLPAEHLDIKVQHLICETCLNFEFFPHLLKHALAKQGKMNLNQTVFAAVKLFLKKGDTAAPGDTEAKSSSPDTLYLFNTTKHAFELCKFILNFIQKHAANKKALELKQLALSYITLISRVAVPPGEGRETLIQLKADASVTINQAADEIAANGERQRKIIGETKTASWENRKNEDKEIYMEVSKNLRLLYFGGVTSKADIKSFEAAFAKCHDLEQKKSIAHDISFFYSWKMYNHWVGKNKWFIKHCYWMIQAGLFDNKRFDKPYFHFCDNYDGNPKLCALTVHFRDWWLKQNWQRSATEALDHDALLLSFFYCQQETRSAYANAIMDLERVMEERGVLERSMRKVLKGWQGTNGETLPAKGSSQIQLKLAPAEDVAVKWLETQIKVRFYEEDSEMCPSPCEAAGGQEGGSFVELPFSPGSEVELQVIAIQNKPF